MGIGVGLGLGEVWQLQNSLEGSGKRDVKEYSCTDDICPTTVICEFGGWMFPHARPWDASPTFMYIPGSKDQKKQGKDKNGKS